VQLVRVQRAPRVVPHHHHLVVGKPKLPLTTAKRGNGIIIPIIATWL
jgi:hypothetical protein